MKNCSYCTPENIKDQIRRGLGDEYNIVTLPMFLPTMPNVGYVCSLGCLRLISHEEWHELEKQVLQELYPTNTLEGRIARVLRAYFRGKKLLEIRDEIMEEFNRGKI